MSQAEIPPAYRVLGAALTLCQLAAGALFVAPWLLGAALRYFGLETSPNETFIRIFAFVDIVGLGIVRFLLPGGNPMAARQKAWSDLATASGGTFTNEKRGIGPAGWTGGPTVRWQIQALEVLLRQVSGTKGSASTRLTTNFPAAKEVRFSVLPNNFLMRAVTSQGFIRVVQSNVSKTAAGNANVTDADRASVVRELGVLAGADVTLGDSRLDGRLIVKGNDADLTRYVLTGGGVCERMNALLERRKGWTITMFTMPGGTEAELNLEFTGAESSPEVLTAGRELMEVLIGSLKQNGVVGPGSASADTWGSRRAAR